jgi:hypothetical protein
MPLLSLARKLSEAEERVAKDHDRIAHQRAVVNCAGDPRAARNLAAHASTTIGCWRRRKIKITGGRPFQRGVSSAHAARFKISREEGQVLAHCRKRSRRASCGSGASSSAICHRRAHLALFKLAAACPRVAHPVYHATGAKPQRFKHRWHGTLIHDGHDCLAAEADGRHDEAPATKAKSTNAPKGRGWQSSALLATSSKNGMRRRLIHNRFASRPKFAPIPAKV